jgi:hypothetical protein
MAIMNNATQINVADKIADTIKTTAGYFTNGDGTLGGSDIYTGSLSATNENYYFNVNHKTPTDITSETQFSVVFAHAEGSGSNTYGDSNSNPNTLNGETQAIYKQFSSILIAEPETSGGFKISQQGLSGKLATGIRDDYIYALIAKRDKFKDGVNKKVWTLILSGSDSAGAGTGTITLTDDSKDSASVATPAGPRYNIVSGALGDVMVGSGSTAKTYGWFYPERGMMVFSGAELSASIPGKAAGINMTASYSATPYIDHSSNHSSSISCSGFAPNLNNKGNPQNALRFVNCMQRVNGNTLRLRSEEDASQESYFCRIKAPEYNFTSNPTFVSGSKNKMINTGMFGNPTTFITGVGLYNTAGQLLAIAQLSKPLKKNFVSEATIKVKLTY